MDFLTPQPSTHLPSTQPGAVKTHGQAPRRAVCPPWSVGALLALLWLGLPAAPAQQPPPGVTLPPAPTVPPQPPGPPGLGNAPRLPVTPIAPPPASLEPPVRGQSPPTLKVTPFTPGKLDPTMLAWPDGRDPGHRAARTPQVHILPAVAQGALGSNATGVVGAAAAQAARELQPAHRGGGHFQSVALALTATGAQPAAVGLRFPGEHAGKKLWAQPVDGGLIGGQPGGRFVNVGPGGAVDFTFQAPAQPGAYHVVVRLDTVQTELRF